MKNHRFFPIITAIVVLAVASLACYFGRSPQLTPTVALPPTPVPVVVQPTPVIPPTAEPPVPPVIEETPVSDTGSEVDEAFNSLLQDWHDRGYITTTDGDVYTLDPFKEESSDPSMYLWWPYDIVASDLLFKGHLKWSSASNTDLLAGCGVMFGLQENDDNYGLFLDRTRIAFFMTRGSYYYEIGKTQGSGRLNYGNPAEADLVLAVKGKTAYVAVDGGDATMYTLSQDQTTEGNFALTLWSGSNVGYGTRCEMTDMYLFVPTK